MDELSELTGFAIVGMSGRFPGARNVQELWDLIGRRGYGGTRFEPSELEDSFDAETRNDPNYVPVRPILTDIDQFDAEFFGMSPRDAALTDPQQRLLLECAWHALEDAGCDTKRFNGTVGVFAGSSLNTYFIRQVCPDRTALRQFTSEFQVSSYQELLGTLHDFVATRIAYKLDLTGPAIAMQSACSTSLLAVAQACQALAFYQCDAALAGGVSITLPQQRGYIYQEGGMVSPDGTCRPFDANAAGTVFGSGAGMVVLKRLADAVADGDRIYAVIKGFGVNNDGATKVGFTAPSVEGQAKCISAALAMAGFTPESIGYIECHGTATPLGDPIEVAGLTQAYQALVEPGSEAALAAPGRCVLGSIKANVGHLDAAAGVTGLIKTAQILFREEIPPQANFEGPNPRLDLASCGFRVASSAEKWRRGGAPRRAGVSAFGVGGTNVHLVLEEAPAPVAASIARSGADPVVLPLSAHSPAALEAMRLQLADHLDAAAASPDAPAIADVALTLREGRRVFDYRLSVAAATLSQAAAQLRSSTAGARLKAAAPKIVFLLPGQGSQYPGMARALYDQDAAFRADIDTGAAVLEPLLGLDIRGPLLDADPGDEDKPHPIRSTVLAQPALFLVEYALARRLIRLGVTPDAMVGHSLGELTAACLSGVMRFEDGLVITARRGRLMQDQPAGAMLSVRMPFDKLEPLLPEGVVIAAANAPGLNVASGPFEGVEELERRLEKAEVAFRRLHTSHAFHSPMIEPVVGALAAEIASIELTAPTLPFLSCVTGTWIETAEATSHTYWARHCREPVLFARAAETMIRDLGSEGLVFVEVGPGRTLSTFIEAIAGRGGAHRIIQALPDFAGRDEAATTFAAAVGALWSAGVPADIAAIGPKGTSKISLPAYPFQRKRFWVDAKASAAEETPSAVPTAPIPVPAAAPTPAVSFPAVAQATAAIRQSPVPEIQQRNPAMKSQDINAAVAAAVAKILEDINGSPVTPDQFDASFLNLGYDSLLLGQVAQKLSRSFGVKLTFRQLMRELASVSVLSAHIAKTAPADKLPAVASEAPAAPVAAPSAPVIAAAATPVAVPVPMAVQPLSAGVSGGALETLMRDQLTVMQNLFTAQLAAVGGAAPVVQTAFQPAAAPAPVAAAPAAPAAAAPAAPAAPATPAVPAADEPPTRFQMYKGGGQSADLDAHQDKFLKSFIQRYNKLTPGSKARTQASRDVLADPRSAGGFRAIWKEIVYPLVCERSKGARITDVDGNSFIDLVNGYGQTMFGHAPDFVTDAVAAQLQQGFAIGPQTPLAGEVAGKISRMTGNERVAFCNTGSEAVMAAMRVARTVTGRTKVVVFAGGYHGQFDEVLVKGRGANQAPGALPIAPGIPPESVGEIIVLPHARPESLDFIRANADDLAAVVTEPVQSRHPDLVPVEFLRELRAITEKSGTALVFDEVVTGFRVHSGGMQAVLGIRADLATYGKVLGGGLPIGVVAGRREFMDALDGGSWRYGDDSEPEVPPTFFAGTFVRHPLVLAAARAVVDHIEAAGPSLYETIGARAKAMTQRINAGFASRGLPLKAEQYASWFYLDVSREGPLASLLFPHLRLFGVNALEGFPCFMTTTHGDAEVETIVDAFGKATDALIEGGAFRSLYTPSAGGPAPGGTPVPDDLPESVPLTEPQKEIQVAAQLGDAASMVFNESVSIDFDGAFDAAAMIASLRDLTARHESLRGRVDSDKGTLVIASTLDLDVPVLDLDEAQLADFVAIDARTPFKLNDGPLVRAAIGRLSDTRHVLVFTAHHIICDGWSMTVLMNDLSELYRARREGRSPELGDAASFRRYAIEQKHADSPEDAAYWRSEYQVVPAQADLPSDFPRPAVKTFNGASLRDTIDAPVFEKLQALARRQGVTLFSLLFCGVQTTLARLAGEGNIVLTVPMAGQALVDEQDMVGHAVNFLPIHVPLDPAASFATHLSAVHEKVGKAFDHQRYTLGTLVRDLNLPRTPNRTPISDVQFNLEKFGSNLDFGDVASKVTTNPKAFVNFDLFVNMIQRERDVVVEVDYSTDLYTAATIKRWIGHLRELLDNAADAAETPVNRLRVLSADSVRWLRDELNATAAPLPSGRLVHHLFNDQVQKTPDALAVRCGGETLTYRQLDQRVNRLANHIRTVAPGQDQRIALALPRSIDMLAALIAILKSGNAYVPLDPTHPKDRLRTTMEIAECVAAISVSGLVNEALPGTVKLIDVSADQQAIASASDRPLADPPRDPGVDPIAHIIFTSGSTGLPKGVAIGHRAIVNLLLSVAQEPGFVATDQVVAVTTVSFDIALAELLLPLTVGGATHIADQTTMTDLLALGRLMRESGATVLQATPSLWRALLDTGFVPKPGTRLISTGEPLPRDLARALFDTGVELWNMYGPTETTIWSSKVRIVNPDAPITIGRPLANTQLHIVDEAGDLCPIGVPGELIIGGDGLAHGYFRRPDLTEAAFIERSINGGAPQRFYRTGDLARRLADGDIAHLGRRDHQVKIRGFRIELEEIEAVLREQPGIADAAVSVAQVGTPNAHLVATLVAATGAEVRPDALKTAASARLPGYMVPGKWRVAEQLPRTRNGKLDRTALARLDLPEIVPSTLTTKDVAVQSEDGTLASVARIIETVLERTGLAADDRLFSLGANSLHIFRIAARLKEDNIPVDVGILLANPSLEEIAALAREPQAVTAKRETGPSLADFTRSRRRSALAS